MVTDPADYRFCSYGPGIQSGHHPFGRAFVSLLIPALPVPLQGRGPKAVRTALRKEFARLAAEDGRAPAIAVESAMAAAAAEPAFALTTRRRVRHWVDGLVIGSELFIREIMGRVRPRAEAARHRPARVFAEGADRAPGCCWHRLKVLRN